MNMSNVVDHMFRTIVMIKSVRKCALHIAIEYILEAADQLAAGAQQLTKLPPRGPGERAYCDPM